MFRGKPLANALSESYSVPIDWDDSWPDPYISAYFRAGMVLFAFKGMDSPPYFDYSVSKELEKTFRRGDSLNDSGLVVPIDIHLQSVTAQLGGGASLRIADESMSYDKIESSQMSNQIVDFGDQISITTRWNPHTPVDKVRIAMSEFSTEHVQYTVKFFKENGSVNADAPAFEFSGPANAVRFYELGHPITGSMVLTTRLDPDVRKTLGAFSIELFQRRASSSTRIELSGQ